MTEKGHGGRGGIWGMVSGGVPGNSHHFGISWFKVVANVPSNIFLSKERPGIPSVLVPAKPWPVDGHCLSWGLFSPPYTFLAFPVTFVCMPVFQRGWHQEKQQNTLVPTGTIEGLSNLKQPSGLRQKGEISVMLIQLRWGHTQIMRFFKKN